MFAHAVFAFRADLSGSRSAPDRARLSARLGRMLALLARSWAPEWIAPPVTARGVDEVSAVLRRPDRALDLLIRLDETVRPLPFRAALAEGRLDMGTESRDAAAMDGPAFHAADDALRRGAKEELPLAFALERIPAPAQRALEQAARLHRALARDWTDARARTVRKFRALGRQSTAAEALGVTPQTVSEALAAAHAHEALGLEDAVRAWLESAYSEPR